MVRATSLLALGYLVLPLLNEGIIYLLTGLSLRAGGWGFSPATKGVAPGYFYWKIKEKRNP